MKQIKIFFFLILFATASIGSSFYGSNSFIVPQVEIIDSIELSDIKEEPSHIRIDPLYQKFVPLNNNYQNPFLISNADPFLLKKPPRISLYNRQ